jgi:hypothetical protein
MARAQQAPERGPDPEDGGYRSTSEELEIARGELKKALSENEPYITESARRVAEILHRAAAEIRRELQPSPDQSF